MGRRNRKTLKNYFGRGKMPTEEHFSDLIDSMLNIVDEGFDKSADKGIAISPLDDNGRVMGFYRDVSEHDPLWAISVDKRNGNLYINQQDDKTALTIDQNGRVGVGISEPEYQLQTSEMAGLHGRTGTFAKGKVPADGKWYNITESLNGCRALEVIAGCGKVNSGSYAITVAIATHCFGAKKRVKHNQSWYGTWCKRIRIRWVNIGDGCILQIRTRCNYGVGIMIQYNISELWDDPLMLRSDSVNMPPDIK
ncbi:MAG: hypothetical protein N4A72_18715 [Bacteroidales bacterium]|jgi:hypothetical protein|nr:hypothetical protein [Bacteroidales bacterium]